MIKTMIKILIGAVLIAATFSCVIGVVLPETSEKARAGDTKATFQTVGWVWGVLLGFGALFIVATFKTGRVPE